jgi:hypothetical protein
LIEAQEKKLSDPARKLTGALEELQKTPSDPAVQQRYLKAFPRDYKSFVKLFDLNQELCDGFGFIDVLPSLAGNYDIEVGALLVGLSKDARYESDAPNYLRIATVSYAGQHTKTFVSLVETLSSSEHVNLITSLADVESHSADKEYPDIVDHLRTLGENKLAREFEAARRKRLHQPHD